jgi:hypothetical protein
MAAAVNKGYSAGIFGFEVGGKTGSYVTSFQIPSLEAEQVDAGLSADFMTSKMLSNMKLGEASWTQTISEMNAAYDWAASLWRKSVLEQDAAIVIANSNYEVQRRVDFYGCLVTGVEWKPFKASDGKTQFEMTCKFKPTTMKFVPGDKSKLQGTKGDKAKAWMTANFRVDIPGLDATSFTSAELPKVEVKQAEEYYGHQRYPERIYSSVSFGDAKFEVAHRGQQVLTDLAIRILQDGHCDESEERDGTVTALDQSLKRELGTFTLKGMGLKKLELPKLEGNKEANVFSTCHWYVQDFEAQFTHKA